MPTLCVCACVYARVCMCACVYMCMHACIYVYVCHIHLHCISHKILTIIYCLVPMKRRRQDGQVYNNSNSFNSYVHEQMAITMAMMEANFKGVGLSNTQQERVEELRAGLDSFSLTNITAAPVQDQKTVFKNNNNRHRHHGSHDNSSHRDMWLTEHHKKQDVDHYGQRAYHDQGIHQLYRSQSYSTNPNHGSYGNTVHHQRRGSEIPHDDSIEMRRRGSYLQQQLDRRGSYLQQSKLSQSIKVITRLL